MLAHRSSPYAAANSRSTASGNDTLKASKSLPVTSMVAILQPCSTGDGRVLSGTPKCARSYCEMGFGTLLTRRTHIGLKGYGYRTENMTGNGSLVPTPLRSSTLHPGNAHERMSSSDEEPSPPGPWQNASIQFCSCVYHASCASADRVPPQNTLLYK
jgi:hypothetical protein